MNGAGTLLRKEAVMNEGTALMKRQGGQLDKDGNWLVLTESKMLTEKDGGLKGWVHSCGETVMAAVIAHPIWDGPFPMSGSGRCQNENVPYCPKCEEKPDFHGAPIDLRHAIWGNIGD